MNLDRELWKQTVLDGSATVEDVIRNLDATGLKIVLVVESSGILVGTISDGDIRRGLLKGLKIDSPAESVVHRDALVVTENISTEAVAQLMVANKIQQIPVVNERREVIGLHLWDELESPQSRSNIVVIMAGGEGSRLRPHTESCPKPMLEVAGKPMLEHIIESAKNEGFTRFVLAIHYLGHVIEEYFEDGSKHGISIEYLREQEAIGTAGALSLLNPVPGEPFVVTNGDVITDIRFGELLDFHVRHQSVATMAVRSHEWQHPFGVVRTRGTQIIGFEEKPVTKSHINAGIYALDPSALSYLEQGIYCDMPSLFELLRGDNHKLVAYPMHEPWLDVGRPEDLHKVNSQENIQESQ